MRFADAIRENARVVARLSDAELERLLPVLKEARGLTARKLHAWLKRVNAEDKYTTAMHTQLISSLDRTIALVKREAGPAVAFDLQTEAKIAALKSIVAMKRAAEAGAKKFPDSAVPLRFDNASVVLDSTRALMRRHATSAARYAGRAGDDIQRQLAVGLVRGESVGETVTRLMKRPYADMSDVDIADEIADQQFFRNRADAERLVRTENVHAANAAQNDALNEDNDAYDALGEPTEEEIATAEEEGVAVEEVMERREDAQDTTGGEGGWQKRWDSTFDSRLCEDCEDMDGEVVDADENFSCGLPHPPYHPHCRCGITPWREGWKL